jgi:hypothetical protein
MPRIILWNGVDEREDIEGEKLLFAHVAEDARDEIENAAVRLVNPFEYGGVDSLVAACDRVLKAESVLGDPARALRLCAVARRKISDCCLAVVMDERLRKLDENVASAWRTDAFRAPLEKRP